MGPHPRSGFILAHGRHADAVRRDERTPARLAHKLRVRLPGGERSLPSGARSTGLFGFGLPLHGKYATSRPVSSGIKIMQSEPRTGVLRAAFSISFPPGRDRSREDSAALPASQPPERERSASGCTNYAVRRRGDRSSPRRERRIQSATDNASPCNFSCRPMNPAGRTRHGGEGLRHLCPGPFEPAASTLTNDSPPAAPVGAKQQSRV